MWESLITISAVGLLVGFLFSVPVAGPISILITSHTLKNERRFAMLAAVGAAIVDLLYCFIAVFGFTQLLVAYEPVVPYIMFGGAGFMLFVGARIMRTRLDLDHIDDQTSTTIRIRRMEKKNNGFLTGFLLNLLNPALFIGWLTSSFIVMSFVASHGFNVGGLDTVLEQNVKQFEGQAGSVLHVPDNFSADYESGMPAGRAKVKMASGKFQLMNSFSYASFVGFGSIIWFYFFTGFLKANRKKFKIRIINRLIRGLGVVLMGFSVYLIYGATMVFLS